MRGLGQALQVQARPLRVRWSGVPWSWLALAETPRPRLQQQQQQHRGVGGRTHARRGFRQRQPRPWPCSAGTQGAKAGDGRLRTPCVRHKPASSASHLRIHVLNAAMSEICCPASKASLAASYSSMLNSATLWGAAMWSCGSDRPLPLRFPSLLPAAHSRLWARRRPPPLLTPSAGTPCPAAGPAPAPG